MNRPMTWPCRIATLLLALVLAACASRPLTVPMRTIAEPSPCTTRPDTLLVLLPGSYSLPEEFQREGFVRMAREAGLSADVLLVDSHMGYFQNRSVVDRLEADVMRPARERGYRKVWMAGISLGAVGAMLYADEHPRALEGVVLIAPFLGPRLGSVLDIENAGGLSRWQAPVRTPDEELDRRLWRWLKTQAESPTPLPIFHGYGVDDRFIYTNRIFSRSLPPSRVFTAPGGHDWPAWDEVWRRIVLELPIERSAACGSPRTVLQRKDAKENSQGRKD